MRHSLLLLLAGFLSSPIIANAQDTRPYTDTDTALYPMCNAVVRPTRDKVFRIVRGQGIEPPRIIQQVDPKYTDAAAALQSQLLYYRLANYDKLATTTNNESTKNLPPRARELCRALLAPCANDEQSSNFLLNYFRNEHHQGDELSASEHALLAALFQSAHMPQNRGQLLITDLTAGVNRYLQEQGEHRQITPRRVGTLLSSFGFTRRRRMNTGWALLLEREDPRRLHRMAGHYGTTQRQNGFVACSLCPDAPPAAQPLAVCVVMQ